MLSLIIYAFVYTPLKRYSTSAVAVGAIPGALPVLIGATAFEANISIYAFCLFIIQFLWQFPHFWSIGFVGFEDYKKAGYKLVPSEMEKR
jgi:protoheme IX farnesyltransferase